MRNKRPARLIFSFGPFDPPAVFAGPDGVSVCDRLTDDSLRLFDDAEIFQQPRLLDLKCHLRRVRRKKFFLSQLNTIPRGCIQKMKKIKKKFFPCTVFPVVLAVQRFNVKLYKKG